MLGCSGLSYSQLAVRDRGMLPWMSTWRISRIDSPSVAESIPDGADVRLERLHCCQLWRNEYTGFDEKVAN